jgi:TolB-like protein/DNA-binding winged helix-turn-helix (wHTH) protein/Flp pilus assembly protein TadD
MIPSNNAAFRIGDWRVEPALDEISRDGETVKLEPRTMRVLLRLAQHVGEVVSVDQLLEEVWKDLVVTHDSVYQAVAGLRHALGDDPKAPVYIANVPRRGYRLIAPVAFAEAAQLSAPTRNDAVEGQEIQIPAAQGAREAAAAQPAMPPMLRWAGGALVAIALLGALLWSTRWRQPRPALTTARLDQATTQPATTQAAAFAPPSHSIAVLPFANISGDKEQDYFSDGLTDELLNSLARINDLQVTGHTSAFYFKGEHADLSTIARKLNVAAILEGSVRRSEHTVRVSVQLINTVTGFGLWSATYDRDLDDVLKLQTDIANSVAGALKIRLLGEEAGSTEAGGTRNPEAFDAYLRASKTYWEYRDEKSAQLAIDGYTDAIRLDPDYALAYAGRSLAVVQSSFETRGIKPSDRRARLEGAQADARKAITLVPGLSEGHLAQAMAYQSGLNFKSASVACERALALGPGNARVLRDCGELEVITGRIDSGLRSLNRALALDPLNPESHVALAQALLDLRRYPEALAASKDADTLASGGGDFSSLIGIVYYLLGDFESARSLCEKKPERNLYRYCLAMTYNKLGRHADAESLLAKIRASSGDAAAWYYSVIYAQWGDRARALDWLEAAMRVRDPALDPKFPLLDPLRQEPRFQAIERELRFPD